MENTIITLDPKKHRIRFYRTLLKQLDNPKYIDLLVDSTSKILAVCEGDENSKSSIKINGNIDKNYCYEVQSQYFIKELFSLMKWEDTNSSYRLVGILNANEKTAFFPLANAVKIDNEDFTNEQTQ